MRKILTLSTITSLYLVITSQAFAGFGEDWEGCVENGVATLGCVPIIFKNIITAALVLAGVATLIFIIYSGFKYITSGGDPKQAEAARKTLTFAIIGLILILCSFLIVNFIGTVTGTTCIKEFGFDNCK